MVHAACAARALAHSYLPFHRGSLWFKGGRPNRKVGGSTPSKEHSEFSWVSQRHSPANRLRSKFFRADFPVSFSLLRVSRAV